MQRRLNKQWACAKNARLCAGKFELAQTDIALAPAYASRLPFFRALLHRAAASDKCAAFSDKRKASYAAVPACA
ncbi:hypothetical protein GQ37_021585 [Janthinobacterium sp. BJB1]|nr:hypothetical protein CSQ90_16825 [Janthinobacterium sp. BJB303]PJC96557.1 hypothetical protein GQ37_021585 [Janthinobacterium sp. BJB1]